VEEDQNRQDVEEALSELVGQRYRVRCVLAQQSHGASSVSLDSHSKSPSQKPDVIDDPVVRAAVEDLGAVVRQ
jgi:hypothetical protein